MSKIRGAFPLFLAITFGVVNGIWVFQPLLAAQQEEKEEKSKKAVDGAPRPNESEVKVVREIEKAASRSSATEAALKPIQSPSSWWPNINLWSKSESPATKDSAETSPRFEATKTNKDGKGENT